METLKIEAKKREQVGKKSCKATRREDMVPCVMYGSGENVSFAVDYVSVSKGIYTDAFVVFELNIDGTKSQAIVKELQFNPTTDRIMHIDFQQLVPGKKVKTEVPLITKGFSKGQQAGGKLEVKQRKIKIKADADKIPTSITIDVTPLELGKSLRIRDIITEGYEILNPTSLPIVSITIPRALRSQQAAAAAGKK
jgi:large subunit ribosomal protein L25